MFEKVKNLRGILYKKMKEEEKRQIAVLPGFSIQKPVHIVEFPTIEDITKINITYPLMEPFAYAHIFWKPENKEVIYEVVEPQLSDEEKELLKKIADGLVELVEVDLSTIKQTGNAIEYLQKNFAKILKEYGINLSGNQYVKLMYYIYRNFAGFNEIEPLLQDPNIEDISCDGTDSPIYIIHRKFGSIKTNLIFPDLDRLREFVVKLSERTGRYVSYAEPILAGTLPDGSRISATLAGDVATHGPTFTIRKFSEKPFSPVEIMEVGTASAELLAYFWYLMQHGISLLIVGGVATGKTSFLNTLAMFIPPESKIVSIEDTRELRLTHEHWIPGLSRVGFGIPTPTGEKYGEVTLFDLLKESFRQNPDYVIVGEVRGAEAYVMFQGMSSGHPSISTFHAGSVDTLIKRLTTAPIDLSPTLIESLDVIAIMVHAKEKGKSARRVKEVFEVESVDAKTGEVKTRKIFEWNPASDTFKKVNESIKVEKIVTSIGGNMEDALQEINTREKILEWFSEKGIKDYLEITQQINLYYKEPSKILEQMGDFMPPTRASQVQEIPEQGRTEVSEKMLEGIPKQMPLQVARAAKKGIRKRISILDLLGMKEIREK
jgi:archaeal flagellar protein FlaI